MTTLHGGSATDTGRTRAINQDDLLVSEQLYAVADGMGGHQGGEVASALAIQTLREEVGDPTPESLLAGARSANKVIFQRAAVDPDLFGMGTTLCAVALIDEIDGHELIVINVGDSRAYLFRDQTLTQITRDHSLVEDLRQEGRLTDEELAVHPHRNIITRALGIAPEVEVDEFTVIPQRGDRLVLCSDGLFNEVTSGRIAATLRRLADPDDAAQELVRQANENGGRDNITCIVIDVVDDDGRAVDAATAAPAVRPRRSDRADLAGFSSADTAEDATDADRAEAVGSSSDAQSARQRRRTARSEKPDEPRPRRFTWRVAAFLVLLVAVLAVTAGIIAWYARGTYYVGFDDHGQVTLYQGRAKTFLWFHPTVVDHTGIDSTQVPAQFNDAVIDGKEWPSRSAAEQYLANIRKVICQGVAEVPAPGPGAPPTSNPAAGPTTTLPRECASRPSEPRFGPTTTSSTTSTTVSTLPPVVPPPTPAPPAP